MIHYELYRFISETKLTHTFRKLKRATATNPAHSARQKHGGPGRGARPAAQQSP